MKASNLWFVLVLGLIALWVLLPAPENARNAESVTSPGDADQGYGILEPAKPWDSGYDAWDSPYDRQDQPDVRQWGGFENSPEAKQDLQNDNRWTVQPSDSGAYYRPQGQYVDGAPAYAQEANKSPYNRNVDAWGYYGTRPWGEVEPRHKRRRRPQQTTRRPSYPPAGNAPSFYASPYPPSGQYRDGRNGLGNGPWHPPYAWPDGRGYYGRGFSGSPRGGMPPW